jgi:hypothetical protein
VGKINAKTLWEAKKGAFLSAVDLIIVMSAVDLIIVIIMKGAFLSAVDLIIVIIMT